MITFDLHFDYKKTMKALIVLFAGILLFSPSSVISGELSSLTKKEPVIIHGSTGATLNFHTSNESFSSRSPFEWNLYGNYSLQIYGIDLPFSFAIDPFSQTHTLPFTHFGITPTFKWAKVHLGISNIQLSEMSAAGHGFNGIGIELTPDKLRFSGFYGHLNLAGIDDTSGYLFERPKYSGIGYGVKLGFGSFDNYIDLSYFYGKDDHLSYTDNSRKPFENEVIGMDFKVKLFKAASLTGNFTISGSTNDRPDAENDLKSSGKTHSKSRVIFSTYNSCNIPAWALESAFSLDLKNFSSVLSYRNVRSDFKSMGTPGGLNDGQTVSLASEFSFAQGKLNINTLMLQHRIDENKESAGDLNAIYSKDNMTFSGNLNIRHLNTKDLFSGEAIQNKNLSASLNYNWLLIQKQTNFSIAASYDQSVLYGSSVSYLGATLGAGTYLLKTKTLNLNGTIGYVFNKNNPGDSKGNITFSGNAGYQRGLKSFSFFVNYSVIPYDKRYSTFDYMPYTTTTHNLTAGVSYAIRF
jgi:hypothetical protein